MTMEQHQNLTGKKIKVEVQIQGYREWQPGVAVGRMGTQLLVQYRTVRGREPRERWFKPDRYQMPDIVKGFVPTLTRYKRETIKAITFPEPVTDRAKVDALWRKKCERCGAMLYPVHGEEIHTVIGIRSHSHIVNAETGKVWS
jgi:hypothetical protein